MADRQYRAVVVSQRDVGPAAGAVNPGDTGVGTAVYRRRPRGTSGGAAEQYCAPKDFVRYFAPTNDLDSIGISQPQARVVTPYRLFCNDFRWSGVRTRPAQHQAAVSLRLHPYRPRSVAQLKRRGIEDCAEHDTPSHGATTEVNQCIARAVARQLPRDTFTSLSTPLSPLRGTDG
jgi:hypothetical protein